VAAGSSDLVVAKGTCYPLFAYEVAQSIDLDAAARRLAAVTERQTVKHKRRAPAYFEYRPAPLRVTLDAAIGPCPTSSSCCTTSEPCR
jgi:hypothetical protein